MSSFRRPVQFNDDWTAWHSPPNPSQEQIRRVHRSIPDYRPTPTVQLEELAREIGVRSIHLKIEGDRFGLPSFKILGASWAIGRAIANRFALPLEIDWDTVKRSVRDTNLKLYAATEGNHGRAVARIASWLGLAAEIHVPAGMHADTIRLIESEGAVVVQSHGNSDTAVREAHEASSDETEGIFIQDFAFTGYHEIPQWIVDGYSTIMHELQEQLEGTVATHVFAPVGAGSFAQSVVSYYRGEGSKTRVVGIEADTAACLWKSLDSGQPLTVQTTNTIMAGLDCGTLSTVAWPYLRNGTAASMTISDYEAHNASLYLESQGISAGPCGASGVAALRRLTAEDKQRLELNKTSVIVLPCTEGAREYDVPTDVTVDDPVQLTQLLVQINSSNPSMGSVPGPGESAIARFVAAWLEHRNLESHWVEPHEGRPSIVGVCRGRGGGKSLMLNGHIDTVTLMCYEDDPLSGNIADGKLYGRGAADMKCGVAAAMVALANAKKLGLRGDVIFTGVADEEDLSIGTEDVLEAGWRADGAIVNEPTNLCVVNAHKGFVWLQVDVHGVAAHGSRADLGIDAIAKAGHFLAELDRYALRLRESNAESTMGPPTIHASLIKGGEEASSYPAVCSITLERRTIFGETPEMVEQQVRSILERIAREVEGFSFDIKVIASRPPYQSPRDSEFLSLVCDKVGKAIDRTPTVDAVTYWTDCALIAEKGIPALLWGPIGEGLHAKREWADINSIRTVAGTLTSIAASFCK
ncbi:hypothetical protein D0869_00518 [Hortaea werneckii]|uniref:Succinyl-diaminopimelate desuccinylase n=1 Tax=Hortaea werneckii TaxID=91943 RepID=A0A3M7BNX8_HORWE|nr:diaminopropionate ammonia-lyase [Hortaea werneckii]KAI7201000.1 diaminopropionate ammonia-lyase [Hortaea werneckii]KAI7589715.1 diaminopropionate ammonia-lyase [Hortaea werneckii]KAI7675917.1 diaminopropionate ammonia-lyase [Hortaea werneckii]RMX89909.1 hypothetical protein D0869_00518 [Hortaea werneckii]